MNFAFASQLEKHNQCKLSNFFKRITTNQATVRSSLKNKWMAGMYQFALMTSSLSNQGSSSQIPFYSRVFCMSRGLPSRFQMQLAPCLLYFKYLFKISLIAYSAGTSKIVQWSLIILIILILLDFFVSFPIIFLESFHHLTSLYEFMCKYCPPGQQNQRKPVLQLTLTLGYLLAESNQNVMSVPAAQIRGVVRGLAMFYWITLVKLYTSPNRIIQQSFAVLW